MIARHGQPQRRGLRPVDARFDAQCARWGIVATYAVCHGEPRVRDRHVRVRDIVERFVAGDSVPSLASDFDLPVQQVEDALRFHMTPQGQRTSWRDRQLTRSAMEGT